MRRTIGFGILFLAAGVSGLWGQAGESDRTSMEKKERLPFSFQYGGKSFEEVRAGWAEMAEQKPLDEKRLERVWTWTEPEGGLVVQYEVIEYPYLAAREWVVRLENRGEKDTEIIEGVRSLDGRLERTAGDAVVLHYALGDHNSADSFAPQRKELPAGEKAVFSPRAGRSSDPYMPFFNVQGQGGGRMIAIGWSGQWQAEFERNADGSLSLRAGLQTAHFRLQPGEKIRIPRIVTIDWKGEEPLAGNNRLRQFMLSHVFPRRKGELVLPPICGSINVTDPDGSYEGPHIRIMPFYGRCGIEVFWSDMDPQQWYPKGFPEGTGTWEPDLAKYPRGLKPIGEAARAAGMEYLLWFEPERVQPGTRIYYDHPEYLLARNGEKQLYGLHDPAARKWLTDYIDVQISEAQLGWLRWDYNIEPLEFWRQNEEPERQGMVEIGYIMGLYAMWEDLQGRHPGLIVDNCASGGRRIDIESCRYGLPLWHSDMQCFGPKPDAEQLQNAGLFRWVPLHGSVAFGLEPSYAFRSAMTPGNILATNDSEEDIRRTVAVYQKARPYMLGDFYPLFPHQADNTLWFGYQFHREDLAGGMAFLFRREKNGEPEKVISLQGVNPDAIYEVSFAGSENKQTVSGKELAAFQVQIAVTPGSMILYYQAAGAALK